MYHSSLAAEQAPPLVLVVEDDPLIALDLEEVLRSEGYYVLGPAPSVPAALGLLRYACPDVAVLDVNLRSQTSEPVAAALQTRRIPFLLASASPDTGKRQAFRDVANIGKPIDHRQLVNTLMKLLAPGSRCADSRA
jgi:two-component system, response regulator PdtaR